MNGYPIILTRTFDCDYFWGFHVKPSFLDQAEAKKFITAATAQIDSLGNGIRQVVFSNDKYSVIGIVAHTADIIAASSLSSDKKQSLEQYTADIRGRKIYGFWGFVCEKSQMSMSIPSYDDYVDIFGRYVIPVWNNKTQESVISDQPINIQGTGAYGIIPTSELGYKGKNIYTNGSDMFGAFISKSMNNALSFCSGLVGAKCIRKSEFENIQTDSSTISNLEYAIEQEKELELQRELERKAKEEEEKRLSEQKAAEDAKKRAFSQSPISSMQNGTSQKGGFGTKSSYPDSQLKQQNNGYGSKYVSNYSSSDDTDDEPWSYDRPNPSSKKKQFSVNQRENRQQNSGINPLIPAAIGAVVLIVVIMILFVGNK